MRKFDAKSSTRPLPLLDTKLGEYAPVIVSILTERPDIMPHLFIRNANSIVSFLQWLHQTAPSVDHGADEEKILIARRRRAEC